MCILSYVYASEQEPARMGFVTYTPDMGLLDDYTVPRPQTSILSGNMLMAREGILPQKSMNFRDGDMLSVYLVLPRESGDYADNWDEASQTLHVEGHDSITVEAGKSVDQLMMYGSGKLSDNGKFYKEARKCKDGVRREPLQIQVYEKLDAGVWFDKGIFDLTDADIVDRKGRKVFLFALQPTDRNRTDRDDTFRNERYLPAVEKVALWSKGKGRCASCGVEVGLRFVNGTLQCARDRGETGGLLG